MTFTFGKRTTAGLLVAAGLALSSCSQGYGYQGFAAGYGNTWDPYYGGFQADPYWGWYGNYYYPGSGVYVFDRSNRRVRWNGVQRNYWLGRQQVWRGARRDIRPVWRDYGVPRRGNGGFRGSPRRR